MVALEGDDLVSVRALSTAELLDAWAQAYAQPPPHRALALLAAACPESSPAELARLTVGRRDGLLLALREWTFGPQVEALAACPRCGERLELVFAVADVRVGDAAEGPAASGGMPGAGAPAAPLSVAVDGYEVAFRLPDSEDLVALAAGAASGPQPGRGELLARCLLAVRREGETLAPDRLPVDAAEAIAAAVAAAMADADPQADLQLDLTCPACGCRWQAPFDIVTFFWSEIDTWAYRTLRHVHVLASAYGWREEEILDLPPWRRQYYLEMVGG